MWNTSHSNTTRHMSRKEEMEFVKWVTTYVSEIDCFMVYEAGAIPFAKFHARRERSNDGISVDSIGIKPG